MNIVPLFIEGLTVHWGVLQQFGRIGARPPILNKIRKAHREERGFIWGKQSCPGRGCLGLLPGSGTWAVKPQPLTLVSAALCAPLCAHVAGNFRACISG